MTVAAARAGRRGGRRRAGRAAPSPRGRARQRGADRDPLPGRAQPSSTCRPAAGTASWISTCRAARRRPAGGVAVPRRRLGDRQQGRDRARRAALPGDGVRGRRTSTIGWPRVGAGAGRRPGQPLRAALGGPARAAVRAGRRQDRAGGQLGGRRTWRCMAALAPASAGFDGLCPGNEPLNVAAVINFFGISTSTSCWRRRTPATSRSAGWRTRRIATRWRGGCRRSTYVQQAGAAVFTRARRRRSGRALRAGASGCTRRWPRPASPTSFYPVPHGGHGEFDGDRRAAGQPSRSRLPAQAGRDSRRLARRCCNSLC